MKKCKFHEEKKTYLPQVRSTRSALKSDFIVEKYCYHPKYKEIFGNNIKDVNCKGDYPNSCLLKNYFIDG